jgi:hypothetical protein
VFAVCQADRMKLDLSLIRRLFVLLISVQVASCNSTPSRPSSSDPVTDLSGVWQANGTDLGGYSQAVIWSITQNGQSFSGTWNNGPVFAGAGISGEVSGTFEPVSSHVTFQMTWDPTAPNPYWLCWFIYHDSLTTGGTGSVSRVARLAVLRLSYGGWTGCQGRSVDPRPPGELTLVRRTGSARPKS